MPDKPFYKHALFWLIAAPLAVGFPIAIAGNWTKPNGKKVTGKLAAKDGKWTIEYTADGKTATTPPFTSTEPGLKAGQEETMWVTERDPQPIGVRDTNVPLVLTIVGMVLMGVGVAVFLYYLFRLFRAEKVQIAQNAKLQKQFAKYRVVDEPSELKSFYVY